MSLSTADAISPVEEEGTSLSMCSNNHPSLLQAFINIQTIHSLNPATLSSQDQK